MRRVNIKKIITIIFIIILILTTAIHKYKETNSKYKDINYVVEKYVTSGILNKYKLYKIDEMKLSFSDGIIAVISVSGIEDKAPHKSVKYDIFLEKNKKDIWKVKKVYSK
ncbi:hypothetical protein M2651_08975 [Clostridium sp. SYSU_GA19001]|uniref:hypothetical protein n=1 Tax=Clostridium caldaquaticum TaxID=2940653 RepID=UPI0020770DE3|nr:hypothetical protein [Clostridium caldaquaticum]MCM8711160.1 hypothetical protein [Clostridium caldaquaticum]